MKSSSIVCVLLYVCTVNQVFAKVIITGVEVHPNKDFLTYSIDVKNTTTGTYLDINIDITKVIDGTISIDLEIFKKVGNSYKSLIAFAVRNICDVLAQTSDTPIITMATHLLATLGSLQIKCPFVVGHSDIKNFKIPDFLLAPLVTGGNYKIVFMVEDHNGAVPVLVSKSSFEATVLKDANSNPETIRNFFALLNV